MWAYGCSGMLRIAARPAAYVGMCSLADVPVAIAVLSEQDSCCHTLTIHDLILLFDSQAFFDLTFMVLFSLKPVADMFDWNFFGFKQPVPFLLLTYF